MHSPKYLPFGRGWGWIEKRGGGRKGSGSNAFKEEWGGGGSLMCFTKPGAWLPAQRSAARYQRRERVFSATSARNPFSGSCLQPLPWWDPPKPTPYPYQSPQQTPGGFGKLAAICPSRAAVFSRGPGGARGLPQDKRGRSQPRRAPTPAPAPPVRAFGAAAEAGVAAALRACPAPCGTALGTHPRRKIKCLPLMISNFSVWLMACKLPPVPSDLPDEAPWRLVL